MTTAVSEWELNCDPGHVTVYKAIVYV